jgi:hypothetical protein
LKLQHKKPGEALLADSSPQLAIALAVASKAQRYQGFMGWILE